VRWGFFFTDRGSLSSAYQHPRRELSTLMGEERLYEKFVFNTWITLFLKNEGTKVMD
jgi:hypothetical protein